VTTTRNARSTSRIHDRFRIAVPRARRTACVSGSSSATGRRPRGRLSSGKIVPEKKNIGDSRPHAGILDANLLAKQGDLGVEAIPLGGEADAMDGAIDGKTAHMGEHEVGEGNDVKRGSLGVLRPRLGQRDGEWGGRHGGRAEHGAALVEG
jgi:hypothetical protein